MGLLQDDLQKSVKELRDLLALHSTSSVLGWCFNHVILGQQRKPEEALESPDRQISFFLGVLLSSPEPALPLEFDRSDWDRAKALLNRVSSAYVQLYMPGDGDLKHLTPEWRRVREVAMGAFLHYFNTGLLASVEQIKDRIAAYLAPFDRKLEELIGISATAAIEICRFITDKLQGNLDRLVTSAEEENKQRHAMLHRAETEAKSIAEFRQLAANDPWAEKARELLGGLQQLGRITLGEIETAFPSTAQGFWKQFTIERGEGPEISYPTEQSVYDFRPLIRMDRETVFCINGNSLFSAVLRIGEKCLAESDTRTKFLRTRDKSLEIEVARHARALFGPYATIWQEVYETPIAQIEHDIIAFDKHLCLVLEAKASPPVEPFRDPEKAFTRIRDAFRGDKGIQKAYEQGNRIVRRIRDGETIHLYGVNGSEVGQLTASTSEFVACACVTRDDFGPLATNLSLLLEKTPDDSFPWATNIIDLATIAEAWQYFK
jgi:hypothetical protein